MDPDPILLDLINQSMEPLIRVILEEREKFFRDINQNLSVIFNGISEKQSDLKIVYRKCSEIEEIKEQLEQTKEKDRFYRYAFYGPHHDDYGFTMDGIDLNSIASQGQKRMALIAFKFALVYYIKENSGKTPIILLDDILSELDQQNRERLLQIIPSDAQVIITNTDINGLDIRRSYQLIELKEEENVEYEH